MPSSTTNYALPYPLSSDNNNVPADMAALATATDTTIKAQVSRPMTVLALAANQAITNNAINNVVWSGAEILDDLNWHSTVTNPSRITPTLAGRYLVNFCTVFAANATGARRCYVLKNGATNHLFTVQIANSANGISGNATGIVICNGTTDYIEAAVFQASGVTMDIQGSGDTTFSTSIEVIYMGNL